MIALLRRFKALVSIAHNSAYDIRRYFAFSMSGRTTLSDSQLASRMLQKAHSIEKALALPAPRTNFGQAALQELHRCLCEYRKRSAGEDTVPYRKGLAAFSNYRTFHEDRGIEIKREIRALVDGACSWIQTAPGASVTEITKVEYLAKSQRDFKAMAESRRSVRMFAPSDIPLDKVRASIELAQWTPSVCNRQSSRVYIVHDPVLRNKALEIQGGNRGFAEEIRCLLIVTSTFAAFKGGAERHQAWVDGGMFSMSLLHALHYYGFGACPLNFSASPSKDRALRAALPIKSDEAIIMMVAVGVLRDRFVVAASPRLPAEKIITELRS